MSAVGVGILAAPEFEGALAAMISSAHPPKVAEVIVIHHHFRSYHPQVNKMQPSIKDAHAFTIGEAGTALIGRNLTTDDSPVGARLQRLGRGMQPAPWVSSSEEPQS